MALCKWSAVKMLSMRSLDCDEAREFFSLLQRCADDYAKEGARRKKLCAVILPKVVAQANVVLHKMLKRAPDVGITVMSDGWTNVVGAAIVSVWIGNNEIGDCIIASHDAAGATKTNQWCADLMEEKIKKWGGPDAMVNVFGGAVDGAAYGSLSILKVKYPWMQIIRDPAHSIDLFAGNIGTMSQTIKISGDPDEYEWAEDFLYVTAPLLLLLLPLRPLLLLLTHSPPPPFPVTSSTSPSKRS